MTKPWSMKDLPAKRPDLRDIPIPKAVRPGKGWTQLMLELAEHISHYAVMQLVDRWGGLDLYVPVKAEGWFVSEAIGLGEARKLVAGFPSESLRLPTAKYALERCRRAAVIADVRDGKTSLTQAAWVLGLTRSSVCHLANKTDEADDAPPERGVPRANRQLGLF